MAADAFREIDGKPIRWTDKSGVVHACEGAEVHPGIRLIWTLCERDVPANSAWLLDHPSHHEMCATCMKRLAPTPQEKPAMADLIAEFTKCLGTISHSRAGWDYQLPPARRAEENRQEREALVRARAIWSENPDLHDDLRAAFSAASPLATMREIENSPAAA